jgi:thiamine pyrophosphokinase
MKKCVILANGKPPQKSVIKYLQKIDYNYLVCADGGANSARKMNLIPDLIVGDLDSISPATKKFFSGKSELIQLKRQNDTDVEKCIKTVKKLGFTETVLCGVTGDRLDHTFCNLGIVIKFFNDIKLKIVAENSVLFPYKGSVELNTIRGETISIYGFDSKTKITSHGLKYKLNNIPLPFGEKESTSNVALSDKIKLDIKGGIIFLIRDFNLIRKYNLL